MEIQESEIMGKELDYRAVTIEEWIDRLCIRTSAAGAGEFFIFNAEGIETIKKFLVLPVEELR